MTEPNVVGEPSPERPAAAASLWRNRSFNLLWTSQVLSDLGSSMAALAIPLLILVKTGSPVRAGVVGTVILLARLLCRLPSGVLADRVDRRRAMLVCDAGRVVAYLVLGLSILNGHFSMALVIAVALVDAACGVMFGTTEHSALRNLVRPEQLPTAVARNEARAYGTSLAGPPLGGVLFSVGHALPFLGNVVTSLASYVGIMLIRQPLQQPREAAASSHAADLIEGIRFVFANPFLRAVLFIAAPLNLGFNGVMFALIVVLQQNGTPAGVIGTAQAIFGVGGLLGAIIAPALQQRLRLHVLVMAIAWAAAALMAVSALLTASVLAAVPLAVAALLAPACNAALFGYQAAITPDRLQGRVVSVIFTVAMSITTVAPVLGGVLIVNVGGPATILVYAVVVGGAGLAATLSTGMRLARPIEEVTAAQRAG